ncbi:hypothetical protein BDN72DRAFT_940533 [Pluteus cervinus]|uniref:Uncharacterized protein n=1 Tax=Pluteus cervinus TaxID=181527 RepID=A0ACD3A3K1_9AGAR|nr:hypothetical protein BDN72DRAFT_940533 [Pluteus cervinus]
MDITDWVLLFHGDLATKERLDAARNSRRIEETPKQRLQFVVFLLGLFHFKMACADAIWRTYIKPQDHRLDLNSMFSHIGILRPNETYKIGSKPTFRQLHDVIHHDIWASILDCWRLEAQERNPEWTSITKFAESESATWEAIVEMSESIVSKYVARTPSLKDLRRKTESERDMMFENQILRNRDELLYLETSHAMSSGDIGRVEDTFLPWIYHFKSTGKHKYANHLQEFMTDLDSSHIIRMNLLCNPTGRPHGFRAIDWVVERNNLYTKVIFAGSGSTRTMEHIINESILIELYRKCHVAIEDGFYLEHRTIRHQPPDMTATVKKLGATIQEHRAHIFKKGRKADVCLPDQISVAMEIMMFDNTATLEDPGDSNEIEIEADDLFDG